MPVMLYAGDATPECSLAVGPGMTYARRTGKGSRTRPIVLQDPELVPGLSEEERAEAVAALADILAAWWAREHHEKDAER
jgi:hypothetical protein